MKKYRVKNKENFIITLVLITVLILIGMYMILYNQIETCEAVEKEIVSEEVTIEDAIEIESEISIEESASEIPVYNIILSKELQDFTYNECLYLDVEYELELSILRSESGFNNKAVSYTGACLGMGQLNPKTAKGLAKSLQIKNFDIFNAEHNISCSIYLIKQFRDYWRSEGYCEEDVIGLTLLSYNRGLYGCKEYLKTHDIYDDEYVNLVVKRKMQLEQYGQFIN